MVVTFVSENMGIDILLRFLREQVVRQWRDNLENDVARWIGSHQQKWTGQKAQKCELCHILVGDTYTATDFEH
jgi:hypothetical protein